MDDLRRCDREGCDREHAALGLCKKHYYREYYRKHKEHLNALQKQRREKAKVA
jgi:hypothetical protein